MEIRRDGKAPKAFYQNTTAERIKLAIGENPGQPWVRYDADPGEVVEGSSAPAYKEKFLRAGFVVVTAEEAELVKQIAAEEAAKVAPKAVPVAPSAPAAPPAEPPKGKHGTDRTSKS
jgi:hypothetical protein